MILCFVQPEKLNQIVRDWLVWHTIGVVSSPSPTAVNAVMETKYIVHFRRCVTSSSSSQAFHVSFRSTFTKEFDKNQDPVRTRLQSSHLNIEIVINI